MQRGKAWEPVARALAERYSVRCVDFTTYTFEERLEELPASGALVGYSMGGRIALHAALREPDRFGSLALVGVSAGGGGLEGRGGADEELASWIETHSIEEVVERWERQPVFATQSDELRARQRAD